MKKEPDLETQTLLAKQNSVTPPTQQTWSEWYSDLDVLSDFPSWYYNLTWIWKIIFFVPFLLFWPGLVVAFCISIPIGIILLIISIIYWMITGKSLMGKS